MKKEYLIKKLRQNAWGTTTECTWKKMPFSSGITVRVRIIFRNVDIWVQWLFEIKLHNRDLQKYKSHNRNQTSSGS